MMRRGTAVRLPVARVLLPAARALALLLAVLSVQAHADQTDPRTTPPQQPLAEGAVLFAEKGCAQCHGVSDSSLEKRVGPDLGRTGNWHNIMQFSGSLWNHTPAMIEKMRAGNLPRASISPEEMSKLAAYLFFSKFRSDPGNVEQGRLLFERRQCARCHQLGGRGGTVGPRLDELKDYASAFFLAQALWNHGPEMAKKMDAMQIGRPLLEPEDVADIVAYIRGAAGDAGPMELAYVESGSPRAGKGVFEDKGCIKCHAVAGKGETAAPDLGTHRSWQNVSQIAAAFWNHGPAMWAKMRELGVAVPKLTDREIADLLAYLYFIQVMGEGGDAAKGGQLIIEKSCARCHAVAGDGPDVGPDLARSDAVRSPVNWAAAMWNHAPAMEQKMLQVQVPWPQFDDDQMRDLVAFLQSRSVPK